MSKQLRELQARKSDLVKEARALTDIAAQENRDLSDEEVTKFNGLKSRIETASAAIDRESALISEEVQMGAHVGNHSGAGNGSVFPSVIVSDIDPAAQAAGTVSTGWISVANHHGFLSLVQTGVLGTSATVDAKLQQAVDSTGTSAKDITGKAITQIIKATGDNKQALINVKPEELDTVNGFGFIRLSLTVGVAASQTAAQVLGVNPRELPANAGNQAAVVQIV